MQQPKTTKCDSCKAEIVFLLSKNGFMPCDAATVTEGDTTFDSKKHKSHFATCPNAAQHRRKGERANQH